MEKNRTTKIIALVALAVAVLGTSVAFASMASTLKITGTATIDPATWLIRFEELGDAVPVGDGAEVSKPVIENTTISGVSVKLTKPGDAVSYNFTVYNRGTIPAVLDDVKKGTPTFTPTPATGGADDVRIVTENFEYVLTYRNGDPYVKGVSLAAEGGKHELTLTIRYKEEATEVPVDDVTITGLSFDLDFVQA